MGCVACAYTASQAMCCCARLGSEEHQAGDRDALSAKAVALSLGGVTTLLRECVPARVAGG